MSWQAEMVGLLRVVINDLDVPYKYSDDRLQKTIITAAQIVQTELQFNVAYTTDIVNLTITPDPTVSDNRNEAFIDLAVLKAACFIDQGEFRTSAGKSFTVKEFSSIIDIRGLSSAWLNIIKNGACSIYSEVKWDYQFGNPLIGEAIMGPFRVMYNNVYDSDINYIGTGRYR